MERDGGRDNRLSNNASAPSGTSSRSSEVTFPARQHLAALSKADYSPPRLVEGSVGDKAIMPERGSYHMRLQGFKAAIRLQRYDT
jgi:hypothetical protein